MFLRRGREVGFLFIVYVCILLKYFNSSLMNLKLLLLECVRRGIWSGLFFGEWDGLSLCVEEFSWSS